MQRRKHESACLLQQDFGKLKSQSEYLQRGYVSSNLYRPLEQRHIELAQEFIKQMGS